MTAKAAYPNPFEQDLGPCSLVASATAGPCTTETDIVRQDISERWGGLPLRLALKIVDASCTPLGGVRVRIWHTNREGSYSGQTPYNRICLQRPSYATANFFRGVQTTAADGTVFFDTCFPGWYGGRAVHIHFQVKDASGSDRVSQLFFPEDVTADICANHPEYKAFGPPDTTFGDDGIVYGLSPEQRRQLTLTVERMSDGAMLAAQKVAVVDTWPDQC
ncbi:MAG: protocatechuate 3,4-dioxygenase [Candidatus Binatia bacterium]